MTDDSVRHIPDGRTPAPMACCPRDGEPLVPTMEWAGAEFVCMHCRGLYGWLAPTARDATPDLKARQAEHQATYDAEYRQRHPNLYPVDLTTIDFDHGPPGVHDWSRWCLAYNDVGGFAVPLVDGYRVTADIRDQVANAWSDAFPVDYMRDRPPDPVGAQAAAARVAATARDNPGQLTGWMLAGWQRHAQTVAAAARAEVMRAQGGTGIELRLVETADVTYRQARHLIDLLETGSMHPRQIVATLDRMGWV